MGDVEKVFDSELEALKFIRDAVSKSLFRTGVQVEGTFHHNTAYKDASSIVDNGILSLQEQNDKGLREDLASFLTIMDDIESHINGSDGISLSRPDTDMDDISPKEDVYDTYSPDKVDFIISNRIKAMRNSRHYGNEFVTYTSIRQRDLMAIDIRMLQMIEKEMSKKTKDINKLIERYNGLREIAFSLMRTKNYIPLREVSNEEWIEIDIDKLRRYPSIRLVKNNSTKPD